MASDNGALRAAQGFMTVETLADKRQREWIRSLQWRSGCDSLPAAVPDWSSEDIAGMKTDSEGYVVDSTGNRVYWARRPGLGEYRMQTIGELEVEDQLKLELYNHDGNEFLIHSESLMMHAADDVGTPIGRWGVHGHVTEGVDIPTELKPSTCMDCSNTDMQWTTCPFAEEVYGNVVYGWWCVDCLVQASNNI